MKNDILGANPRCKFAMDLDSHILAPLCDQGLSSKDMLNLACANTESQSPKGTMGRGVAVTADNSGAWESKTLLGTDDVDDSLTLITKTEVSNAKVLDIVLEGHTLESGIFLFDKGLNIFKVLS